MNIFHFLSFQFHCLLEGLDGRLAIQGLVLVLFGFGFFSGNAFLKKRFGRNPQKTNLDLTVHTWKAVSNWIAYTHKTLVLTITGLVLVFVVCDEVKEYGCMNNSQKCGIQYNRGSTGNIILCLRLEANSCKVSQAAQAKGKKAAVTPTREKVWRPFLYHIACINLAFPFRPVTVVQTETAAQPSGQREI